MTLKKEELHALIDAIITRQRLELDPPERFQSIIAKINQELKDVEFESVPRWADGIIDSSG